jgi:type IV secretion system protein VirB10
MTKDPRDIRPVIATGPAGNWGMWIFFAVLLLGGLWLFNTLSAAREAAQAPSVLIPDRSTSTAIASPAPLTLPDRFTGLEPEAAPIATPEPSLAIAPRPIEAPAYVPPPIPREVPPLRPLPQPAQPQIIFEDRSGGESLARDSRSDGSSARVDAQRFLNPSYTIPQGTVIPAVLETAIDSTQGGGARALVQRDIFSFDGTRMLIPRGSRLYGEYQANLRRGQNRTLVQWTRLIRPDGVTIALNSPSSDPLGRAGVKGKVDGKFWQRFGGAVLNSVLDIGVGLAVNEASDGVIVALPGSTQNVAAMQPDSIQPTLKVKHGTSVSVFVARDLDFSSVER